MSPVILLSIIIEVEHLSCDSLGRDLQTVIIGMFAVSTSSAPYFCFIHKHTPHTSTIWDNIYQPWAIEAYFCFPFVAHHWHGTCQKMVLTRWNLRYRDVTVSGHILEKNLDLGIVSKLGTVLLLGLPSDDTIALGQIVLDCYSALTFGILALEIISSSRGDVALCARLCHCQRHS